jgi:type 1 fimbria pilin
MKRWLIVLIALVVLLVPPTAFAATFAEVTITATPTFISITNDTPSWALGTVSDNNTNFWWKGAPPTFPLDDTKCTATITNDGSVSVNIAIKGTDFTGGVKWTLVTGVPGVQEVRVTTWKSGDAEIAGINLTTSDQPFITPLAATATKKWEMRLTTASSFTDGVAKQGKVYLTASQAP